MGIEAQFTSETVRKPFDALLEVIERKQVEALKYLGEKCVTHARSVPAETGFNDVTGNLRSSIGYAVFVGGVAVHAAYESVKGATLGTQVGEALAMKVGQTTNGVCLVVTAGMHYAQHVEARGKDVITSAEHLAERELPRMLEHLIKGIKRL